jgi:hypothetical protein
MVWSLQPRTDRPVGHADRACRVGCSSITSSNATCGSDEGYPHARSATALRACIKTSETASSPGSMNRRGRRAASRSAVGSCRTVLAGSSTTATEWAASRLGPRIPPLQGDRGRPRRPQGVCAGHRGDAAEAIRDDLRARRIVPLVAMRRTAHGSHLGRWRRVVERTFAG